MFEQGRRWVWRHQQVRANSKWATSKIYSKQFGRITWQLSPRRGEPDLKTGESLFISLPVPWKGLGTLSAGPSFVTLIQHVRHFSPGDGCAFGCKPLYGLLQFEPSHDIVIVVPKRGRHTHTVLLEAFIATVHPQLTGVHSIGATKDGNNNNFHWWMV